VVQAGNDDRVGSELDVFPGDKRRIAFTFASRKAETERALVSMT
jgi:hypothetical protein